MADHSILKRERGRKYSAFLISIPLWVVNVAAIVFLSASGHDVPGALGFSLAAITSVFPGYIGVNVIQKKIESKAEDI